MCEANSRIPDVILWNGWRTTWEKLHHAGWEITVPPKYSNWRLDSHNKAHQYMYIRHPETRMIGRLNLDPWEHYDDGMAMEESFGILDFLTHERNQRVKPKPIYVEAELTVDDIPMLLDLVLQLQQKHYPKPPKKPDTKVVQLRKTA